MVRLIASDLDGTLLQDHDCIHPDNLVALRRAMDKGVAFAMASGRSAAACSQLALAHGLDKAFIIGVNGGHVWDAPFGDVVSVHHLPQDVARAAMDIFVANGLQACLYTEDAIVYSDRPALAWMEGKDDDQDGKREILRAGMRILAGPTAMDAALRTTPLKTFCVKQAGQEAAFARAREMCARLEGVELTSSWSNNFEVMPLGVNKGEALKALAGRLGIAREEVMAFGDSENDIPMLAWASYGYAMANAQPEVRDAVQYRTGACGEGGVAQAIARWL